MNRYKGFVCFILVTEVVLLFFCNGLYLLRNNSAGRLYRVEAKRAARDIEEQDLTQEEIAAMDLSEYETLVRISRFDAGEVCNNDYVVEEIGGKLYRIEYCANQSGDTIFLMNSALLGMMIVTGIVLFYIEQKILKPFRVISNLSYELAKGNLSIPVKEEKSKLFGRFLWGMDMLREKLEENRERELEFQKDRKTLILSLSHDIKTPLSSIALYAKALEEDLYDTQDKREQALQGIRRNAKEIKKFVNEIAAASREDFLNLEVKQGECYLSEIIKETETYYRDKLSIIHTEFKVGHFPDCLIKGDKVRLIQVMQNIMENAVKYGDGKSIQMYGEEEEDCKLVHIENSGSSLKEEELPNLFDSFYRGSNSHGVKGNGLGLYICKTLMQKMDGEVFAQTRDENFRVTVVLRKA
ncbi:MAG TPA: HAMP domain-containing histidine kinase [Candidatus Acetatifactor stercoripullorum]|uniref:histidine kinase n=1 Tax=Candidatus Acetatifactor stercoripullorum TaxID=2838414 RepID=A0A9D1R4J3_9FIRM|nr:HAMP domain-containing sensor histidine kinase [uncultured Acetatifactor sp.]HIW80720.1 HAMP domain-containing histidine kinase [Candidatus Acetatifactor stercoripullorum]